MENQEGFNSAQDEGAYEIYENETDLEFVIEEMKDSREDCNSGNVDESPEDVSGIAAEVILNKRLESSSSKAVGITLAAIILAIALLNIIIPDKEFSEKENRTLAQMPTMSLASIVEGSYASNVESYITDQFPGRDFWMKARTSIELMLGKYYSNGVYKGADGYLFEDVKGAGQAGQAGQAGHNALAERVRAVNGLAESFPGIHVSLLLVPNAGAAMEDRLPAYAPVADQNADIDSVIFRLSPKVSFIDVRDDFEQQLEAGEQLYYRTDHHWTSYGAYRAFLQADGVLGIPEDLGAYTKYILANDFYGTMASKSGFSVPAPDNIETYVSDVNIKYVVEYVEEGEKTASVYKPEKLETADKYTVFFGGNYSEIRIRTTADSKERLLLIKDSYANCFVPFLIPYYNEIIMIDPRYYYGDIHTLIKETGVNEALFLYNANTFFEESSIVDMLGQ